MGFSLIFARPQSKDSKYPIMAS
jgi:hypothetical protein